MALRLVWQSGTSRQICADGAIASIPESHFAAITEPKQAGQLMRSIFEYAGHATTVAALKLSPLVFVRPGELRTAEWAEIGLGEAEWRIPGSKMKNDHVVPLSRQAVAILRSMQPISGHGRYVFPSLRTGERPMSDNTINAALRSLGYNKDVAHCPWISRVSQDDPGRSAG